MKADVELEALKSFLKKTIKEDSEDKSREDKGKDQTNYP